MSDLIPPHNLEAERALLGSIIINPDIFSRLAESIKTEDLFILRHRYIWEAVLLLSNQGTAVDLLTILEVLKTKNQLSEVGGISYLLQLLQETPTCMHAESYALIVKEYAYKRHIAISSSKMAQCAYSQKPFSQIEKEIEELVSSFSTVSVKTERLVISADRLCSSSMGELTWILKDWIMAGGINLIAGMPAAGKSFLTLDLAIGIASTGFAWNNQEVTKGKVMYHFLDGSLRGMRMRVLKLCAAREIQPPANLFFDFSPLNLREKSDILSLRQMVKKRGISVVIFDVMAKFMPGADENSVAEISPIMNAMREISNQLGTAFILIHHLNKGTNSNISYRVRGSTDILGSVDTAIIVNHEMPGAANSMRVIQPQKMREIEPPKPLRFQLISTEQSISLKFVEGEPLLIVKPMSQQEKIYLELMQHLQSNPGREFLKQVLIDILHLPKDARTVGRAFAQLSGNPGVQIIKKGSFKSYRWKTDEPARLIP